jgi:plasmid stability protein
MKATLDLPDDLLKEVRLRAVHEGKKLKDAVAELLRKGLANAAGRTATVVKADKATLSCRREVAQKFISGQWGVELAGFAADRAADRASARERSARWRK